MSFGNTVVEGIIMVILGFFMYIWAQNAAPLANIAQGVCNNPLGQIAQSVLGQNATDTCNKVNLNANIVNNAPLYGITIVIFGFILIIIGAIQRWKENDHS
jgi:uncharacterized membrane protein